MGCQWAGMGKGLMSIPVFADSMQQCQRILNAKNIDLISVITEFDDRLLQSVLHSFIGITAIQVCAILSNLDYFTARNYSDDIVVFSKLEPSRVQWLVK